ncbi:hypothetical protein ABZW30_08230 [Kitasatospora sp. NPDC004669]|uniref:hypothetical protein n=1 Tax=Kitasatospora sp. NPDC004669 TaxID=3154555 RepID=UPI0033B38C3A
MAEDERLFLFTVDGSDYGPYPGLITPRGIGPYCSPAFTRSTARQIVRDLHADAGGMTAAWHGVDLVFSWSADYDGDGGQETVEPDHRGLYRIGGHWPWDHTTPATDATNAPLSELPQPPHHAATCGDGDLATAELRRMRAAIPSPRVVSGQPPATSRGGSGHPALGATGHAAATAARLRARAR